MDTICPRCGSAAETVGHEDARLFHQCARCGRIWATELVPAGIAGSARHAPRDIRVLVADDCPDLLRLIAAWLEDEGYEVVTAGSGGEVLDIARAYRPDVILLDIVMPPPNGLQICEALRPGTGAEVILMTGLHDPANFRRGAELGAAAILIKPLDSDRLLAALDAALVRRRWRSQPTISGF